MKYAKLESPKVEDVVQLFYDTFKASESEEEALAVSGLVRKFLQDYPRNDLKGFVAQKGAQLVGCVFFSQLKYTESDAKVFILSPMAVLTAFHGQGIGQALINYAHKELRKDGVNVTTTYGDIQFYSKTGYAIVSVDSIAAPHQLSYPKGWLAFSLDGTTPLKLEGTATCIPELNDPNLW
jgi:predicted N-acetyltransferase YhbS